VSAAYAMPRLAVYHTTSPTDLGGHPVI
jgi:hypothetical protein